MEMKFIIPVIIVVVLLLIVISYYNYNDEYLYGFWTAQDDDFCRQSQISSMYLFIGNSGNIFSKERECHLIISLGDVANQGFTMKYRPSVVNFTSKYKINAKIDGLSIWPENVNIEVDPRNGTMKIYDKEYIFAKLYKQHDVTNASKC